MVLFTNNVSPNGYNEGQTHPHGKWKQIWSKEDERSLKGMAERHASKYVRRTHRLAKAVMNPLCTLLGMIV